MEERPGQAIEPSPSLCRTAGAVPRQKRQWAITFDSIPTSAILFSLFHQLELEPPGVLARPPKCRRLARHYNSISDEKHPPADLYVRTSFDQPNPKPDLVDAAKGFSPCLRSTADAKDAAPVDVLLRSLGRRPHLRAEQNDLCFDPGR